MMRIDSNSKGHRMLHHISRQLGLLDSAALSVFGFGIMMAPSVALNLIDRANDFDNTTPTTRHCSRCTFNTPRLEFGLMGMRSIQSLTRLILDTLDSGFIAAQQHNADPAGNAMSLHRTGFHRRHWN